MEQEKVSSTTYSRYCSTLRASPLTNMYHVYCISTPGVLLETLMDGVGGRMLLDNYATDRQY